MNNEVVYTKNASTYALTYHTIVPSLLYTSATLSNMSLLFILTYIFR